MIICKNCGKEYNQKNPYASKGLYCSNKCQREYIKNEKINKWLSEGIAPSKHYIKNYLLDTYGNKCYVCGITDWNEKPIVMELEHIDGNSNNDSFDNLKLICPNCHSQTDTYKGKNKGSGRHYRMTRYHEGKSF